MTNTTTIEDLNMRLNDSVREICKLEKELKQLRSSEKNAKDRIQDLAEQLAELQIENVQLEAKIEAYRDVLKLDNDSETKTTNRNNNNVKVKVLRESYERVRTSCV